MTDVAGLVIGVVTAWKTCVQVFDIVDSGKKYGIDYERLRVKLEVERIRLLSWGDAVGLGQAEAGWDPRLKREDVRATVLRLLGCIQHVFEHTDRLEKSYGLVQSGTSTLLTIGEDELPPSQSQVILGSIFARAYETLRKSAKDRQRGTPLRKKTVWAIQDKKKFHAMVVEIRELNDNLHSLFPNAMIKARDSMRAEINDSVDIQAIQTLQEAAEGEHEDISETASVRLEALGATITAPSRVSRDDGDIIAVENRAARQLERHRQHVGSTGQQDAGDSDSLETAVQALESYVGKKSEGSLHLSLNGPDEYSAQVRARVHWDGKEYADVWWNEKDRGYVQSLHESFDLYRRRRYIKPIGRNEHNLYTDEDGLLYAVESNPKYDHVNPGTVTVEGFGMECWNYEELFGKNQTRTIMVSHAKLPEVPASSLLRRVDELRRGVHKFGWNPEAERADLEEFFGKTIGAYTVSKAQEKSLIISDFYMLLNRTDIFAEFTAKSSIALHYLATAEHGAIGLWNFLWQVILAKELAQRLGLALWECGPMLGFTPRVLSSLIVQDLFLSNTEIVLKDQKVSLEDVPTPRERERARAEFLKNKGNEAVKQQKWQAAVDFFTQAVSIDLRNAVYRSNRSGALLSMGKADEARSDAWLATRLDPKYAKGWARLGLAEFSLGNAKRAQDAHQRAVDLAGSEATPMMKQGLIDAKAKIKADAEAINKERNPQVRDKLRKKFVDQDWDIAFKTPEVHSLVHERQVEGLLLFAKQMKWPYIDEARDYAEDVYDNLSKRGLMVSPELYDWLYGLTLPGHFMSWKIMSALILCSPSIAKTLNASAYYDCGLTLPKQSYWRARTALASVLGCLPGVVSLCGWIGPCPPVEILPSSTSTPGSEKEPRHILLKTRRIAPIPPGGLDRETYKATQLQPDEDMPEYLAEMQDGGNWVVPQPPVRELSTCTVEQIQLKELPVDAESATDALGRLGFGDTEAKQSATPYRASIVFSLDNNEAPVKYTLYANPIFVTPPPCYPGPLGAHEVHVRELPRYQRGVYTVDRLKEHAGEDGDEVTVINATGKGAEVLARAWCAERGRHAIIRRAGGPCFVCAVRAASKSGLGVGVLIWAS